MRTTAAALAALFCLTVVRVAASQSLVGQDIAEVRFEGLQRVSEQLVRSQVEVHPGDPFNPRAIARDIRRLYDLGHFSNIKVDAQEVSAGVILTYLFVEKRTVEEIKIVGNDHVRTRAVRGALSWREGDSFVAEAYQDEREAIRKLYQSKGYPNAGVDIVVEDIGPSRVRVTYLIDEGKKARIDRISFVGNETLSERQLRKLMETKRRWWFLGGKYDAAKLDTDLDAIIEEYANYGRLEAEISAVDLNYAEKGKGLDIAIHIEEGPEYRVATLDLVGNAVYDDDEILGLVKVHPGEIDNVGQVQEDADLIQKGYRDSGYIKALITVQRTLDREKDATNLLFRIDEGQLQYVHEVKITGNRVTKDEVVRREILTEPGDRFDGSLIEGSERRLNNTRYFENIRMLYEDIEGDERFANLLVDVEEGKTGNVSFGAGYSSQDKFGGFAELRLDNFDISNWPTFSGGGQLFQTRIEIGDRRNNYSLSFTDPEIFGYPLAFGIDLYDESYDYRGGIDYTEESTGAQIRFGKVLSPFVTARSSLRYSDINVEDLPTGILSPALRTQRGGSTTISSIWGINRNTLDSYRDPSTGAKHDLQLEIAGLGGDNEFWKLEHDSVWYRALTEDRKWVLSFRTREGIAEEYGSSEYVPLSFRFFAGGISTVRGYDHRDIGPKERTVLFDDDTVAVGGKLLLVNNLEVKYKLTEIVRFYGFADAGSVWREWDAFDLGDVKCSIGLGLGVDVPKLGPIRVDYGYPLNPDEDQGSGRLHLSSGFRF